MFQTPCVCPLPDQSEGSSVLARWVTLILARWVTLIPACWITLMAIRLWLCVRGALLTFRPPQILCERSTGIVPTMKRAKSHSL